MKKNHRIFIGKLSGFISVCLLLVFTVFYAACFVRAVLYQLTDINQNETGVFAGIDISQLRTALPITILMLLFVIVSMGFCVYFTVTLIKSHGLSLKRALIIMCIPLFSIFFFGLIPPQSYLIAMYSLIRNLVIQTDGIGGLLLIILKICQILSLIFTIFSCMILIYKDETEKQLKIQKLLLKRVSRKKQIVFLLAIPLGILVLAGAAIIVLPILPNFNVLGSANFVGYENYLRLFLEDEIFIKALTNTYIYPIITVLLTGVILIAGKNIRTKNTVPINGLVFYPFCYVVLNIVFGTVISAGVTSAQIIGIYASNYAAHTIINHISDYSLIDYSIFASASLIALWFRCAVTFIVLAVIWTIDACVFNKHAKTRFTTADSPA